MRQRREAYLAGGETLGCNDLTLVCTRMRSFSPRNLRFLGLSVISLAQKYKFIRNIARSTCSICIKIWKLGPEKPKYRKGVRRSCIKEKGHDVGIAKVCTYSQVPCPRVRGPPLRYIGTCPRVP